MDARCYLLFLMTNLLEMPENHCKSWRQTGEGNKDFGILNISHHHYNFLKNQWTVWIFPWMQKESN